MSIFFWFPKPMPSEAVDVESTSQPFAILTQAALKGQDARYIPNTHTQINKNASE